jgi:hypothetical protein
LDKPYFNGMENTNRSYLFKTWCHAPTLPRRHRWIKSRSNSVLPCLSFMSTDITHVRACGNNLEVGFVSSHPPKGSPHHYPKGRKAKGRSNDDGSPGGHDASRCVSGLRGRQAPLLTTNATSRLPNTLVGECRSRLPLILRIFQAGVRGERGLIVASRVFGKAFVTTTVGVHRGYLPVVIPDAYEDYLGNVARKARSPSFAGLTVS